MADIGRVAVFHLGKDRAGSLDVFVGHELRREGDDLVRGTVIEPKIAEAEVVDDVGWVAQDGHAGLFLRFSLTASSFSLCPWVMWVMGVVAVDGVCVMIVKVEEYVQEREGWFRWLQ